MKLSVKEMKQFNRCLELSLKMIPIVLAIFLVGNILFNISYFSSLQFEWSSLLSLSDYYEGSILYVAYAFLMFLLVYSIHLFHKKGLAYIKNLISYVYKIVLLIFTIVLLIPLSIGIGIIQIIMIKKRGVSFRIKRKYISFLKGIKSGWHLIYEQFFLQVIGFIAVVILIIFLLMLFITIIYTLYLYNWLSLIIAIMLYINLLLLIKQNSSLWKIAFICVVIYWYTMWSIGGFTARPNPGYDLPFLNFISNPQMTHVVTAQQQDFILVRTINKGVIVKDNEDLYFFQWEDVKYLRKQKVEKQEKTDAKK